MPARKVKLSKMANGSFQPEVELCSKDREKLQISEYHRMYFGLNISQSVLNKDEETEELYKLHRIYVDLDVLEKGYTNSPHNRKIIKWVWIAMWNSSSWTSIYVDKKPPKNGGYYETIDEALNAAILAGWKVCQLNYDNMEWIINSIKHEHGIR